MKAIERTIDLLLMRQSIPELPQEKKKRFMKLGIPEKQAETLVSDPETARVFEEASGNPPPKPQYKVFIDGEFIRFTEDSR